MRATWKGVLQLGNQKLPVKLYAAVHDTAVHFHMLHADDGVRVEQRLVSSSSGEPIEKGAIRKGYALEPGRFVILEESELKALQPDSQREIELLKVVPLHAIAPPWFERPYILGPDGDASTYVALVSSLRSHERQAIVQWSMRGRSYTGALRAHGERLLLIALRDREEVEDASALTKGAKSAARAANDKELALAEQLVSALEGELDPSQFHSDYQERLHKLVEQKARGKHLRLTKPRARKSSEGSLEHALSASLKAGAQGGKKTEKKSA